LPGRDGAAAWHVRAARLAHALAHRYRRLPLSQHDEVVALLGVAHAIGDRSSG
jgi:hypothetical protein